MATYIVTLSGKKKKDGAPFSRLQKIGKSENGTNYLYEKAIKFSDEIYPIGTCMTDDGEAQLPGYASEAKDETPADLDFGDDDFNDGGTK